MFQVFGTASFHSIWYWVLTITVWSLVCHRTLGVPHDMVLRARRAPDAAERVDLLARIAADRLGAIYDSAGTPIAAAGGFLLAALAALGFLSGIEIAQAVFLLLFPLAVVAYSTLRLALAVRRRGIRGADLRRSLRLRRLWHQVIAVLATLTAAVVGATHLSVTFVP